MPFAQLLPLLAMPLLALAPGTQRELSLRARRAIDPGRSSGDERIDLDGEFRRHFAAGDPRATLPELVGIAVLTDGDQTRSASSGDYAHFVLTRLP